MGSNKKRILSGVLALWLLGNLSYSNKKIPNYEIVKNQKYFANYSNGKIYIGKERYIERLNDISENDVLIVDGRREKDPKIKILSSYKITDPNVQREILEVISEYEKKYPTSWDRSVNSMEAEWFIHNILYYLNYERERTQDVDFNNSEKDVYSKKLIKKIVE